MRGDSARTRPDTAAPGPATARFPIPLRADSILADTARRDTTRGESERVRRRPPADTIKAPLAQAEAPVRAEDPNVYQWDRGSLFASGALTLLDLLERVPGVVGFRSGWVPTPHTAEYLGTFAGVRIFYDGVELDPLDWRMGGMLDLSFVQLWSLEDVVIERAPEELRVYVRSWRADRTTALTRVDVYTGDQQSNSYRGFYGKRFAGGTALQAAGSQFSTSDPRVGGDGDLRGYMGRLGWARPHVSLDAFFVVGGRSRSEQARTIDRPRLPALEAKRTDAYLRAAYGDPDAGPWLQLIAATSAFREQHDTQISGFATFPGAPVTPPGGAPGGATGGTPVPADTVDSTASRSQYVLAGGWAGGGLRLSGTARYRVFEGRRLLSPSGRASFSRGPVVASVYAARGAQDSVASMDVSLRWQPGSRVALGVAAGRSSRRDPALPQAAGGADRAPAPGPIARERDRTVTAARAELGLRVGRLWLGAALAARDSMRVLPPIVYDTGFQAAEVGRTTATTLSVRGTLWKDVGVDVAATRWRGGAYLPTLQTSSRIFVSTGWLTRFPSGNFHVLASIGHEYRGDVPFPISARTALVVPAFSTVATILEIRLLNATLSWQLRNAGALLYEQVPGFQMPRALNFYGVRWNFSN